MIVALRGDVAVASDRASHRESSTVLEQEASLLVEAEGLSANRKIRDMKTSNERERGQHVSENGN